MTLISVVVDMVSFVLSTSIILNALLLIFNKDNEKNKRDNSSGFNRS